MKKILNYMAVVVVIATLAVVSCKKGLTDETYSVFDASKLTMPSDGNSAVLGTYAALKDNGGFGYYAGFLYELYEYPADVVTSAPSADQETQLDQLTYNPSNNIINSVWTSIYKLISRANESEALIEKIDYAGNGSTDAVKNQNLGEVRFLRALAYYDATSIWGDVPLMLKPSAEETAADLRPKLTGQADVEAQIVSDLEFAEANLPASYPAAQVARATNGAASSLLARLYMRQGQWQKAADETQKVISAGVYRLKPQSEGGIVALFDTTNRSDNEFIFVLKSSSQTGAYGINSNSFGIKSTPWDYNRGWSDFRLTLQFYALFDKNDQRRQLLTGTYKTIYGQYRAIPTQYGGDGSSGPDTVLQSYTYNLKYPAANNYNYSGYDNVSIIRYADVLLYRAEALNELNGPNQESITLINQIRERAGIADITIGGYTKATLRDEIFMERNKEFFMEGRRREDLLRWGNSETAGADPLSEFKAHVVPFLSNANTYSASVNYKYFPYPQSEIQSNTSLSASINKGRY